MLTCVYCWSWSEMCSWTAGILLAAVHGLQASLEAGGSRQNGSSSPLQSSSTCRLDSHEKRWGDFAWWMDKRMRTRSSLSLLEMVNFAGRDDEKLNHGEHYYIQSKCGKGTNESRWFAGWSVVSSLNLRWLALNWRDAGIGSPCWEAKLWAYLPQPIASLFQRPHYIIEISESCDILFELRKEAKLVFIRNCCRPSCCASGDWPAGSQGRGDWQDSRKAVSLPPCKSKSHCWGRESIPPQRKEWHRLLIYHAAEDLLSRWENLFQSEQLSNGKLKLYGLYCECFYSKPCFMSSQALLCHTLLSSATFNLQTCFYFIPSAFSTLAAD